jgi:CubicO group peptidase (beta-lactamase class C family)
VAILTKQKKIFMKLITTLLFILITQFALGQERIKRIDSLLSSLYSQEKINGNFLVAENGKVIYSRSFGIANESTKEKLNENSIFNLASVSKQFTAMAIMILKEKGKLNLDDEIKKYIPELSIYSGVTIRHLLNHTSGLPDYSKLLDSLWDKTKIANNKNLVALFSKHKPTILFKPNAKYIYSNTGYAMLALVIEKASGYSYSDYLNKTIFKPLKMKNTFVYTARLTPKHISNLATGYMPDSLNKYVIPDSINETKFVYYCDGIVGQGRVHSTTLDLLKWDRALYTNKLLSKEGIKEIFEVATLEDKSKTKYGFGWIINENADFGKTTSHDGSWPGYKTHIDRYIDNDKTIIILQNHEKVTIPIKSIRNILYNKPLAIQKIRTEIKLTNNQLQKFVGIYEIQKGVEMNISLNNDQLFTQLTGQNALPIFAENEMLFFLKIVDAQIQFEKNEAEEIIKLYLLQNGNKKEAKRKE